MNASLKIIFLRDKNGKTEKERDIERERRGMGSSGSIS